LMVFVDEIEAVAALLPHDEQTKPGSTPRW
jgi:hypothetical protein